MDELEATVAAVRQMEAVPSILQVVCDTTGMGFAAVARVSDSRWVACEVLDNIHFGLEPGGELPLDTTICNEIRTLRQEVVIDHVSEDDTYRDHPKPAMYGFQSYISVPIILPGGEIFGTLCAIDPQPRKIKGTAVVGMFRLFAQLIAFHLDANQQLNDSRSDLRDARADLENSQFDLATSQFDLATSRSDLAESQANLATSEAGLKSATEEGELREQFIAVLGHDLRNPLASFSAGIGMLSKGEEDVKKLRVLRLMTESAQRMGGLIDNLLDFARGRLGAGIGLELTRGARIEPVLARIANEIISTHPERVITIDYQLPGPVDVDPARIGQLFSNLLGNAITHGSPELPITVTAKIDDGAFELTVCNGGAPISDAAMERLFQPFYRGQVRPSQQGLGLGLYIASQIAKAHGGSLTATSCDEETCFTFRMPIKA